MSDLTINLDSRLSRSISNEIGERSLSLRNRFEPGGTSGGGIIQKIWNFLRGIVGFLWKRALEIANLAGFSPDDLLAAVTQKVNDLWCFNWQATDTELQSSIAVRNAEIAQAWQNFLQDGAVSLIPLAIGYGLQIAIPALRAKALFRALVQAQQNETADQLKQALVQALIVSADRAITNGLISGYMWIRRAIRSYARGINWDAYGFIGSAVGDFLSDWGERPGVHWSFAKAFGRTCTEVTPTPDSPVLPPGENWDDWIGGDIIIREDLGCICPPECDDGEPQKLVITPDVANPSEKLVLYGSPKHLPTQLIQALNTHELLGNRDIGYFDLPDTHTPLKVPSLRELRIILYTVASPPLSEGKRHSISIPKAKAGLTWGQIKAATTGLTTGSHYAYGRINNDRSKIFTYGDSAESAIANLQKVATLSEGVLGNIATGKRTTSENDSAIEATEIYPIYANLSLKVPSETGKLYIDGSRYDLHGDRLTLWYENSPIGVMPVFDWLAEKLN